MKVISFSDFEKKYKKLKQEWEGLEFEMIPVFATVSSEEQNVLIGLDNVTWVETPSISSEYRKYNIGYNLISAESKYVLFLDNEIDISKEDIEKRLKFMEAEQLVGAVGEAETEIDAFVQKVLMHKLLSFVHLTKDEFEKLCCDEKGEMKLIKKGQLFTSVKMFDRVGGFSILSEYPFEEYCLRVLALGYTLLNLKK